MFKNVMYFICAVICFIFITGFSSCMQMPVYSEPVVYRYPGYHEDDQIYQNRQHMNRHYPSQHGHSRNYHRGHSYHHNVQRSHRPARSHHSNRRSRHRSH